MRTASHMYREEVICVPSTHMKSMGRWAQKTNGHPGVERTQWFFEKFFYTTLSQERLNEVLREVCTECPCSKAKQSTSADQGLTAHLPVPRMVNSVLYLDFTEIPKYSGHDFALLVTCGLSRFTRAFPLTRKWDGETVLKELFEGWIQAYGMPKRIHTNRDIRFTSRTGWYTGVLKNMGVEVDSGTPNYKKKNTRCERQIKAFKTITRLLLAKESGRNWIKLVPVSVYMMNNQISSRTGYSPTELLLGRPDFFYEFLTADDCNTKVKGWLQEQRAMAEKAQELPTKVRNREHRRQNRGKSHAEYREGDRVLVHHTRFPRWPRNGLDLPYFGPYLVTEVEPGTVKVKASPSMGGFVNVGYNQLKGYRSVEDDDLEAWEELAIKAGKSKMAADEDENEGVVQEGDGVQQLPEMDDEEMKERDCYTVELILQHKYKHGGRFLTRWAEYEVSDSTPEPISAFVLDNGNLTYQVVHYCRLLNLTGILETARKMAQRKLDRAQRREEKREEARKQVDDVKEQEAAPRRSKRLRAN